MLHLSNRFRQIKAHPGKGGALVLTRPKLGFNQYYGECHERHLIPAVQIDGADLSDRRHDLRLP